MTFGGLAGVLHLRAVDRPLALEHLGRARPRGATYVRAGGGDLQGDFLEQRLEVVGARDEVRLAVELDEHADLAAHVDVGADEAFARGPARLLGGLGEPALAQNRRGLLEVAVGFLQGGLALHHAGAGLVAQLFDQCSGDVAREILEGRHGAGFDPGDAGGAVGAPTRRAPVDARLDAGRGRSRPASRAPAWRRDARLVASRGVAVGGRPRRPCRGPPARRRRCRRRTAESTAARRRCPE